MRVNAGMRARPGQQSHWLPSMRGARFVEAGETGVGTLPLGGELLVARGRGAVVAELVRRARGTEERERIAGTAAQARGVGGRGLLGLAGLEEEIAEAGLGDQARRIR